MAALTNKRMSKETRIKNVPLPLAAGQKVWQRGMACMDTAAATVKNAAASTTLIPIGEWAENLDNSAGTGTINALVDLDRERVLRWYDNATGANAVTSTDLFTEVYMLDDHTVTKASSGNSKVGRVWMVSSTDGVAVEKTGV